MHRNLEISKTLRTNILIVPFGQYLGTRRIIVGFILVGIGLPVLVLGFVSLAETARANQQFELEKQNRVNYTICHHSALDDLQPFDCIYEPEFDAFMPYKIIMGGSLAFFGALAVIGMSGKKEQPLTSNDSQLTQGAPFK